MSDSPYTEPWPLFINDARTGERVKVVLFSDANKDYALIVFCGRCGHIIEDER